MAIAALSPDIQATLQKNLTLLENYRQTQWAERQRRDGQLRKLAPIGIITAIGLLFLSFNAALMAVLLMAVGGYGWRSIPAFQFSQRYKQDILPVLAKTFGQLTYSQQGTWDKSYIEGSGIVPHHTDFLSEDHFQGTHKGITIHLSEVTLRKEAGKNSKKTIFRGLFIQLSFQMNLGRIVVTKDAGFLGNALSGLFSDLQRIHLEDVIFEGAYEVYADDQVNARRLLTPAFMQRLLNLSKVFDTASIALSVRSKDILILVPYAEGPAVITGMKMQQLGVISARYKKDNFEAPPLEKKVEFSHIESLAQEIASVLDMVDYLKIEARQ